MELREWAEAATKLVENRDGGWVNWGGGLVGRGADDDEKVVASREREGRRKKKTQQT